MPKHLLPTTGTDQDLTEVQGFCRHERFYGREIFG